MADMVREPVVTVRRRWNDAQSAGVPLGVLRDLAIRDDPGGICGPVPRPFLTARVWCDHLGTGTALHACDAATAPHELELVILERDNPPDLMARLRSLRRRA
jgi:hypothetical protein